MKKKIVNGILLVAILFATVSAFVSCKDTDSDVRAELDAKYAALEKRFNELQATVSQIKSCECEGKYYTKAEIDKKVSDLNNAIQAVQGLIPDVSGFVTISQLDSKLQTILADYYTKTQVNVTINEALQEFPTTGGLTEEQVNALIVAALSDYAKKSEIPASLTGEQVNALIATALGEIPASLTEEQVNALIATALGEIPASLTEEQVKKLDSIGMVWENVRDLQWNRNYQRAKEFYDANGHLRIPGSYVTDDGVHLGQWIASLRSYRKSGSNQAFLNSDRTRQLDAIGMIWDVPDYLWNRYYSAALDYYKTHGDLDVPKGYVTADGVKLFHWLANVKEAYRNPNKTDYRLTDAQIQMLNELQIEWRTQNEVIWENAYAHAAEYFNEHGDLAVAYTYQSPDGFKLGKWIAYVRDKHANGKLDPAKISKLNQLHMIWKKADSWEKRFALAEQYYREHGNLDIPPDLVVDGIWIGQWLKEQRQIKNGKIKNKSLTAEQVSRLESIGMYWGSKRDREWAQSFEEVKEYLAAHGNCDIPFDYISKRGTKLGAWLKRQIAGYEQGKLSEQRVQSLRSIGV